MAHFGLDQRKMKISIIKKLASPTDFRSIPMPEAKAKLDAHERNVSRRAKYHA